MSSQLIPFQPAISVLQQNDVTFAGLFGSAARDEADEESDVDILVRFAEPKSLLQLVALEQKLSTQLKKKVDLVTEASLSPYFRDDVLRDIIVLYEKG